MSVVPSVEFFSAGEGFMSTFMIFPVVMRSRRYSYSYISLILLGLPRSIKTLLALRSVAMRCWLCEFSDDQLARNLTKFISEQAVTMGPELMAERVHEALVDKVPMSEGIGLDEVREHIMVHTLSPSVRVACIMRSLLKLTDKLEGITTSVDPETGQTVVEAKNVTVYLKVVSEVMQMYRTGEVSKLLFAPEAKV